MKSWLSVVVPVLAAASISPSGWMAVPAVPPGARTPCSSRFMIMAVLGLMAWVCTTLTVLSRMTSPVTAFSTMVYRWGVTYSPPLPNIW